MVSTKNEEMRKSMAGLGFFRCWREMEIRAVSQMSQVEIKAKMLGLRLRNF